MKQVKDLVPKTKFDFSGIEELRKLSDEEIAPVIPDLLAWMRDMNWPVAKEMPDLLAPHQKVLLPLLDEKYLSMLKPSLERIVKNPTWGELDERTNVAAAEILNK